MNRPRPEPAAPHTGKVEMPDLYEAVLDDASLEDLVDDLIAYTEILDVRLKGSRHRPADPTDVQLQAGIALLRAGAVHAVQVRYRYDDAEWRDTLMRGPAGVRLVRVLMPW